MVGKYRFIALVLALLLCCNLFGCSNNEAETFDNNDIYLSNITEGKGGSFNIEDYYYLYFNYVYTQKNLLRTVLIDTKISVNFTHRNNDDYKTLTSKIYIGGEEQNTYSHTGNIIFLTPNMSITIPLSFSKFDFEHIKTLVIEIFYTENSQEVTIDEKTFTQAELNKQLQEQLQKDDE